jgi:alpha-N-acetylglucosaminidase
MSQEQIEAFLAGPPYLPFQWMGCLDSWGGPLPKQWVERHAELQQKILARQRELGMTPVLQGFTGHVPAALQQSHPDAKLHTINWIEWETYLLDPLDPLFAKIAAMWIDEQTRLFGTNHYYAADTFIEMTPPSGEEEYLGSLSRAIYDGMAQSDPRAVWVLQGWAFMFQRGFWTLPRIEAFLDAVPDERVRVLDLMCEARPMWNKTRAFCGKPWLWCNIQDWGGNVFLGGALNKIVTDLPAARRDADRGKLVGLGFVNEGLGYNPVIYDLLYELAWRDEAIELDSWLLDFTRCRYGAESVSAQRAWKLLQETVYTAPHHTRSIIDHTPTLSTKPGSVPYDNEMLADAWHCLLNASHEVADRDTYAFDIVNVGRQVLVNHASVLHHEIVKAHRAQDAGAFAAATARFLQLLRDIDRLLATRQEFLLGRWISDARRWGTTDEDRQQLEWNARRVLTLWGETTRIDDYARKDWSGMIGGYYLDRWQRFLAQAAESIKAHQPFEAELVQARLREWMVAWSDRSNPYPTTPRGDSLAVARELWEKYKDAFGPDAISLTTGKPATCSHAIAGHSAHLANDGRANNTDRYWATDVEMHGGPAWWQVDLQRPEQVGRVVVVGYYGDQRYYGFTVETSLDGVSWDLAADLRANREQSKPGGYNVEFPQRLARYLRINQTGNSANSGRHLVEVMAYER